IFNWPNFILVSKVRRYSRKARRQFSRFLGATALQTRRDDAQAYLELCLSTLQKRWWDLRIQHPNFGVRNVHVILEARFWHVSSLTRCGPLLSHGQVDRSHALMSSRRRVHSSRVIHPIKSCHSSTA